MLENKHKRKPKFSDKTVTKLKKNLSSGFKDVEIRELNISVSAEMKRKYFSTWIGKVKIICDEEVPTSGIFKDWERKGKVNSLKKKKVDLALYNESALT